MEVEIEKTESICVVNNDDLKREFDDMSVVVDDDSLLSYAKRLCILYNIDALEFVAQWFSFASQVRVDPQHPSLALFERFEREHVHRKAVSVQTEILEAPKKKIKTEELPTDMNILREYGSGTSLYTTPMKNKAPTDVDEDLQDINENESVLKKHIVQYYGNSLSCSKWINKKGNTHIVLPFNASLSLDKPYKYMKLNLHFCSEVMDEFMEKLSKLLKEGLGIDSFDEFTMESNVERYYVGRVRVEPTDGKVTDSIYLEMDQYSRRRAKLDLSELSQYSLFSGQVIAVKSTYDFNRGLKPSQIADPTLTINPFSAKTIELKSPLFLVAAAGPYNISVTANHDLLLKLLDYIKEAKPQFVILTGPFVDTENIDLKERCNPLDLFKDAMNTINHRLHNTGTKAIVVPSPRDLHHDWIYPTPAFQKEAEAKWPNIHFAPNPCLLDISGIVIAINGTDVLMHMIRNEIARIEGEPEEYSRLLRLCKHLLSQQSFYPLSPADPQINLQYTKLRYLHLPVTPHLFLLTSQLKSFAKRTAGCVFVNTESISKRIISRIKVEPLRGVQGALDNQIDVEIIKL